MTQRISYNKLSPAAFEQLMALSMAVKQNSSIEKGLIHLVELKASMLNGCAFCLDMHAKEAKLDGETALRMLHLTTWRESNLFNDKEKAALRWTEVLTKISPEGATAEEFDHIKAHFSEQEISDLTFVITTINAWNRLGVAFTSVPGSLDSFLKLTNSGL